MSQWKVVAGDCIEVMRNLPDNSFDSIVTDPPAGIAMMNKDWDCFRRRHNPADVGRDNVFGRTSEHAPHSYGESDRGNFIAFMTEVMKEAIRVVKPGGHAFVWALPRTAHWTAFALEDAGWDLRDRVAHLHAFGTGFPKSKALADGIGTALKPGYEIWLLARKPVQGSITANYAKHGTGGLNIDACRVNRASDDVPGWHKTGAAGSKGYQGEDTFRIRDMSAEEIQERCGDKGRWPPNLLLSHSDGCRLVGTKRVKTAMGVRGSDSGNQMYGGGKGLSRPTTGQVVGYGDEDGMEKVEVWECAPDCPVAELDRQSGTKRSRKGTPRRSVVPGDGYGMVHTGAEYDDIGGASRFFPTFRYQAKPSSSERNAGLDEQPDRTLTRVNPGGLSNDPRWGPVQVKNSHPTLKSISLMRWLCSLITPVGGYILDPFLGSGSTGAAAVQLGYGFYGCDKDPEYVAIAEARIRYWESKAQANEE